MLTEDEMREYIDIAEKDEWDPARWKVVSRRNVDGKTPFLVSVSDDKLAKLEARAKENGLTVGEYLDGLVGAVLAIA